MALCSISSLCGIRQCFGIVTAVVVCVLFCLPMTTTALPMKDVVGQAMMTARMEQQQQQQQEHHRQKRAVTKTNCAQPDNLDAMFQQINSQLSSGQFLYKLFNGKAISITDSKHQEVEMEGVNKTCPSSLTSQPGAALEERSLCPYYFNRLDLPEGYYPNSLKTARCKCQSCVQNGALGCEAVSARIAVLKPVGCFQGLQKYQEEHIHVNTACTCASGGSTQTTTSAPTTTTTSALTTTTTLAWGVQ